MSIGNLKDSGNQGNNFPWQLKVLQGLQGIINELQGSLDVNITAPLGQQIMDDSVSVVIASDQAGVARTPTFLRPTGANGTIAAGTFSMSFASVGTGNAIVGGIVLKPGETLNFDAGAINNTLGAVAYNTLTNAGAELIIITLT
jgi:hypothetical protein